MFTKTKNLNLVYVLSFVDLFAVGLTVPLFSNHLRELGASHFTIGLLNSLYSGLQVISGPIVGSWSDVRDRRSVLQITLLLCSLGYVALGLTNSLLVIASVRILLGVTKHTQSICKAIITDLVPPSDRASAFGRSTAFGSLGFIIGPTLGGHLIERKNGFFHVCLFTSVLFIINVGITCAINEIKSPKKRQLNHESVPIFAKLGHEFNKSVRDMGEIDWGAFWDVFLLRFIFGFSVTMYFSQQSVYLKEQFKMAQRHVGYTISFFSASGMAAAFLLHYINYFYKGDVSCLKRLTHFFLLMTLSLVCLYFAPNIELFLLVLVPFSLSCTVLRIVSMELMLKNASTTHRGSLSGTSNSIMSVARFVTPVTSGLISDKLGGSSALLFTAVPPLIGTLVSVWMKVRNGDKKNN
ncbi:major facilitator superfamily domain-containing protein 9 isoform X2 [Tribolium castaneum]|uniref:Major facilitator superfamily domain-containing protein 9-like Protein n=1 Tax=Tribolium castaneum TaxID=7070 RepID=D6X4Q1_TRICA|nr:PREDICTED: major facilitator superfamily domain-containing protein 9 isoform X2 [Tribolium castaneum]EEZ97676.1 Major facilitator superfamily domain-containing protein 9-like Protein [Tribolium castaneum]|eukprot:XP_008199089.1 PREDICTED: major facilitator superfamily domain-containing protein 9 isoform X2 [Tribolium castaneum]